MGSEFTYEDVGSLEFDKYRYRFIRDETLDQTSTHVVERFPTDEESAYARQVLWLDTREYRVLRIDYYDRGDRLVKSLSVEGYRQYARGQWRPDRMVMSDHRTGKSTTLDWRAYAFESGLTDEDFDPLRLGRTR